MCGGIGWPTESVSCWNIVLFLAKYKILCLTFSGSTGGLARLIHFSSGSLELTAGLLSALGEGREFPVDGRAPGGDPGGDPGGEGSLPADGSPGRAVTG